MAKRTVDTRKMKKRIIKMLKKSQSNFSKATSKTIGAAIEKALTAGRSPVKGQRRFVEYSDSYKKQIQENDGVIRGSDGKLNTGKRVRPVNLFVSGKARASLKVKRTAKGVNVKYKSKIMGFHDKGAGNNPRRAILPGDDEVFNRDISKMLKEIALKSIANANQKR